MTDTLFCAGYGYTAEELAKSVAGDWRIIGSTRSPQKAAAMRGSGVAPVLWDGPEAPALPEETTAILVSTPPDATGCPAFQAYAEAIAERSDAMRWIGYLSTNGVYGDHKGEWVDENAFLYPSSDRARRRIAAEALWAEFGETYSVPVVIFRLPGIYGPGRSALDTVRAGRAKRILKEGQVFSRAHVADIATALRASLDNPAAGGLFNIADDEPAPPQDVIAYACELLGVAPPPLIPIAEANLSEMAASFYADNKRVNNHRMKADLGVQLKYPTYRDGLKAIFDAERVQA